MFQGALIMMYLVKHLKAKAAYENKSSINVIHISV